MEPNRSLFMIMKHESDKTKSIVHNVLLMLSRRIYIDKKGEKMPLLDLSESKKSLEDIGDNIFVVVANTGDKYAIKLIYQKISAIGKQSPLSEFFREYAQHKKIIVATDYNNKIADYVVKNHAQIFREGTMMSDILAYRDQPTFELLSPKEVEAVKTEYGITDYTTKKILRSDPITRYFALKKGDYLRVIRASPTSGKSIDYRVVM